MSAPLEQRHIDIVARYVLDSQVTRLAEGQRITAVGPIETTTRLRLRSIVMG